MSFGRQISPRAEGEGGFGRQISPADDPALKWTRKFCGGVRQDIARKLPGYITDWTDAFTDGNLQQSVACIPFLFFATIAPALTFGAAYEEDTNDSLGVVECIISTAFAGVVYAVFSGQPLNILGATGPKFAYIVAFYELCKTLDVDFLTARVWLGLWCSLFLVLFALTDASSLMVYATRYMEETFSAFISLIFIVSAIRSVFKVFWDKGDVEGFLSLILATSTCVMALKLKELKTTRLLNARLRKLLGDFAVSLSILVVSGIAQIWRDRVDIDFLDVPESIEPSFQANGKVRDWFINPFGNQGLNEEGLERDFPVWVIFFTAIPGLGMALLNYLDQNLTTLLVNRPSMGLKKPVGYHLDMLVVGLLIYPVCAVFGLTFPIASTVPALTHVISLTTYEDRPIPGGGVQKVVTKVVEQRFTHFAIHAVMFLALLASPLFKYLPNSVLHGVFMFMGITSMVGNQLFDRIYLWGNFDPSTYPRLPYVTRIRTSRLHLYTGQQVVMLVIIYMFQFFKETGVAFPFFIAGLLPLRYALNRCFTEEELEVLDAEEDLPPDPEDKDKNKNDGPPAVKEGLEAEEQPPGSVGA